MNTKEKSCITHCIMKKILLAMIIVALVSFMSVLVSAHHTNTFSGRTGLGHGNCYGCGGSSSTLGFPVGRQISYGRNYGRVGVQPYTAGDFGYGRNYGRVGVANYQVDNRNYGARYNQVRNFNSRSYSGYGSNYGRNLPRYSYSRSSYGSGYTSRGNVGVTYSRR